MRQQRSLAALLVLSSALVAGCLPSSCARVESRSLFPADSLSRALAERLPVDTLKVVFEATGPAISLAYPRTVQFDREGNVLVSDAETGTIVSLGPSGNSVNVYDLRPVFGDEPIPYLAGQTGDTTFVFLAGVNKVVGVRLNQAGETLVDGVSRSEARGRIALELDLSEADAARQLRYVAADGANVWVKTVDPDGGASVARYDLDGNRTSEIALDGAYWSHAGPLRADSGSVLSIRGFLPAVARVTSGGSVDSMRFAGFDSPMLPRMRSFLMGEAKNPPLLIPAIAICDGRYFVINIRPGWLRIDVYDGDGQIEAVLTEPDPGFNKSFYPTDVTVHREGDDYLIGVSLTKPPSVRMYAWRPRPDQRVAAR